MTAPRHGAGPGWDAPFTRRRGWQRRHALRSPGTPSQGRGTKLLLPPPASVRGDPRFLLELPQRRQGPLKLSWGRCTPPHSAVLGPHMDGERQHVKTAPGRSTGCTCLRLPCPLPVRVPAHVHGSTPCARAKRCGPSRSTAKRPSTLSTSATKHATAF